MTPNLSSKKPKVAVGRASGLSSCKYPLSHVRHHNVKCVCIEYVNAIFMSGLLLLQVILAVYHASRCLQRAIDSWHRFILYLSMTATEEAEESVSDYDGYPQNCQVPGSRGRLRH